MSIEKMTIEEAAGEINRLRVELVTARENLAITQAKLVQLQSSSIVKYVADIQPLINALAGLLQPNIEQQIKRAIGELKISARVD